jgi:GDP-D-mannose dehydratase
VLQWRPTVSFEEMVHRMVAAQVARLTRAVRAQE